ncbi:MAG: InlB B-repeat-containing protein [Treponema sp.]|nr:InlB B-repeat-containing protein [Treponema sp.]
MRKIIFAVCVLALVLTAAGCRDITPDLHDTYVVIFNNGTGGTTVMQTDIRGRLTSLPPAPTRDGYQFGGWITMGLEPVTTRTVFHEDTTVIARWIPPNREIGLLEQALDNLRENPTANFSITLTRNENILPQLLYFNGTEVAIELNGGGYQLTLAELGTMFTVGDKVTLTIRNVEMEGSGANIASMILVEDGGKLFIENGTVIARNVNNNTVVRYAGGVTIQVGGEMTMNGGDIIENETGTSGFWSLGGGVLVNGGLFTMNGGVIRDNVSVPGFGGGVRVDRAGKFFMYGGDIAGNMANYGGGVSVDGYRYERDSNGQLRRIYSEFQMGDPVLPPPGGNLLRLFDNFTLEGGGVLVDNLGTFNMYDGLMEQNQVVNYGGGVSSNEGVFNLFGGRIYDNNAQIGGGVYNYNPETGLGTMHTGFVIERNEAQIGGGVVNDAVSTFYMYGGQITGNEAPYSGSYGGGVVNFGTFYMHGGSITGNLTDQGGGVTTGTTSNRWQGTFIITGGQISGNGANYASQLYVRNIELGRGTGGGAFRGLGGYYTLTRPPAGVDFLTGTTVCPAARQVFFVRQSIFLEPMPDGTRTPRGAISIGRPIMGYSDVDPNLSNREGFLFNYVDAAGHLYSAIDQPENWTSAMGTWVPQRIGNSNAAVNMGTHVPFGSIASTEPSGSQQSVPVNPLLLPAERLDRIPLHWRLKIYMLEEHPLRRNRSSQFVPRYPVE